MAFYWTCPYCNRDTTVNDTQERTKYIFSLETSEGFRGLTVLMVVCPNPECRKFTLTAGMFQTTPVNTMSGRSWINEQFIKGWNLIPDSEAKVFPDYVPHAIRDDYVEACKIRDLSPKASATLSRRCLQGMIRDFWKISKARLIDEIEAIKGSVDAETWAAIDAVRSIGNIGAHMEKDINIIVDVDPDEAQLLIGLIELLIKDWYITRQERTERLAAIVKVKTEKDAAKNAAAKSISP